MVWGGKRNVYVVLRISDEWLRVNLDCNHASYVSRIDVRQTFFLLSKTMRIAPGQTGRQDDTDCTEDGQSADNHAKKMAMTVLMTDYGLTRIVIRLLFLFVLLSAGLYFALS